MRRGAAIALLATLVLVGVVVVTVVKHGGGPEAADASGPFCSATVDGHVVELGVEQAQNAALISAVAVQRGMPARAASIALATAYQESYLYNVRYGDRDSLGLFQQRPSQGWGTRAEILDPEHATNAFYDALDRIDNYPQLDITVAAQEVQHSAYPDAYATHEGDARALASALTGNSPAAFTCHLPGAGRTGSSSQIRDEADRVFGDPAAIVQPSGVSVSVRGRVPGWAVAQYYVAQAAALGIDSVAFDGRTWHRTGDWTDDPGTGRRAVVVQPVIAAVPG